MLTPNTRLSSSRRIAREANMPAVQRHPEPEVYISVAAVMLTVALMACYRPAQRAARVDPANALRYE